MYEISQRGLDVAKADKMAWCMAQSECESIVLIIWIIK